MSRAFIITFDGLVALMILFIAIYIASGQNFQPVAPKGVYLKQLTLDTLTVLEKSGRIGMAIEGNSSAARQIMEATGESVCMQISIIQSTGTVIANMKKEGCDAFEKELQVAARPFIYGAESYYVKAESWYDEN